MRSSTIQTQTDSAGTYETETFSCDSPKSVIICSHGNGVRRWDGKHFFHNVAQHYPEHVFLLADQNQTLEDGCKLNNLNVMVGRVQKLIDRAQTDYPGVPVIVIGHSMGCGVAARLNLDHVAKVVFVAPTAGDEHVKMVTRYGEDVLAGKKVLTSDGLTKLISKEFVDSTKGLVWEHEYEQLLQRYKPVYAFESGSEEIVSEARFAHRDMPFAGYKIIPGATHNLHGPALNLLYTEMDELLP